ncbi:hypothetical protein B0H34DRAFT_732663 [Crassisporium funariophilum]|nr:hypothetical protein B0H34DRAFT_732663 [Crassisporium funariophilum]
MLIFMLAHHQRPSHASSRWTLLPSHPRTRYKTSLFSVFSVFRSPIVFSCFLSSIKLLIPYLCIYLSSLHALPYHTQLELAYRYVTHESGSGQSKSISSSQSFLAPLTDVFTVLIYSCLLWIYSICFAGVILYHTVVLR